MAYKTLCGTGHRAGKMTGGWRDYKESNDALARHLTEHLIQMNNRSGTEEVISGMALGWDTILAMAVIDAKRFCKNLRFIAAVPCHEQERTWQREDREFYRILLKQADEIHYVTEGIYQDNPRCMWMRNQWMVERSDGILSYYNGLSAGVYDSRTLILPQDSGGTYGCLKYARNWALKNQLNLPIRNFYGLKLAA